MKRVFVVEDEAIVALELQDHLRAMGYEVCGHAMKGEVALRQVPVVRPDLVLMDINLGSGISGLETADRLRAVVDVPVLFLTAFSDVELTQHAATTGAFGYVTKPFDPRVLEANIELALVRHAADQVRQASEERFLRVVNHVSDAIVADDLDGRIVFANRRFLEMFGLAADTVCGRRLEDYAAPPWRELLRDRRRGDASEAPVAATIQCEGEAGGGSSRWTDVSVVAVRDRAGAVVGTQSVLRDVTESRTFAETLERLRRHYEAIFHDASEGIFRTTIDGTIIDVNDAFARIVGYNSGVDLRGASIQDFYRSAAVREQLQASGEGREVLDPVDLEWRRRSGDPIVVEASGSLIRDAAGTPIAYQGFVRDVTEARVRAAREKQLLAHNEQLELVIEGTRLGFWEWSPKTNAAAFSDRWAKMFGYQLDQLSNHVDAYRALVHEEDLPGLDALMRAHFDGETDHFKAVHRMRHREGRWLHVLSRGKVFERDALGRPVRFCGTHTDITAELKAEEAALEATRAKTHFLATMSHELRTPLNAVLGLSEALLERVYGDLTPRQERSLRTMHESGRYLLTLINDILDVARFEAGKLVVEPSEVLLSPLVAQCVDLVRDDAVARRLQLRTELDHASGSVTADPQRLKQVLLNLLTNGIKFSPPGATVTVGSTVMADGTVEIWVSNPGPYIAVDDRERIFEPFVRLDATLTREQPGAGLGLAVVKRIAQLHGGNARVESVRDQGNRFIVALPRALGGGEADRAGRKDWRHEQPAVEGTKAGVVLLVEDSEANIQTLGPYLEAKGYAVRVARDGLSAVSAAQQPDVAVVLMDISLPVISGLEAIRRIRSSECARQKPIIAVTAHAMLGDEKMCLDAGATCYRAKPLELGRLAETLGQLLAEGADP